MSKIKIDPLDYQNLNEDVRAWAKDSRLGLKASARKKRAKKTGRLIKSVTARTYKRGGITDRIGFRLLRYGVFVEKGVGKGRPIGSRKAKQMAKAWFNPEIQKRLPELANLAAKHHADVNARSIFIK